MIKALIFDAYGTLISTGNGSVDAARKILLLNNRTDISAERFYSDWKSYHKFHIASLKSFIKEETIFLYDLEKLYCDYNISGNAKEDVKIMLDTLDKRKTFPETKAVLEKLSSVYKVCIGSTTDTKPLMLDLQRNKLKIDKVFTSENLRYYKPQKEFYEAILNDLNIAPNEAMFIGDSLIDDVLGPQSVGISACRINRKNQKSAEIKPNYEITNLEELLLILKKEGTI